MASLDFDTSAQRAEERAANDRKPMVIRLDGRKMKVKYPTTARAMMAMRAVRTNDYGKFIDFMLSLFKDRADREHIMDRIEDDDDPFDVFPLSEDDEGVTLHSIFKAVMEEMAARPTGQPSDSPGSQKGTGRTSTAGARPKAKRRSTSPSTAS